MTDRQLAISAVVAALLFIVMVVAIMPANWYSIGGIYTVAVATSTISSQMFDPSSYGITVLIVAVLLGASMVGGVYLAKEE